MDIKKENPQTQAETTGSKDTDKDTKKTDKRQANYKFREVTAVTLFQDQSLSKWKVDKLAMQKSYDNYALAESDPIKLTAVRNTFDGIISKQYLTTRTNGNRVYNPMVKLHRAMRKNIFSPTGELIQIDIANSHPLLIVHDFIKKGFDIEPELKQVVEDGKFYDIFNGTRDERKASVFQLMYNKEGVNPKNPTYITLLKHYPKFAKVFFGMSTGSSLSMEMQRIEANIWIDGISDAAMYLDINHVTAHDSIIFERSHIKQVMGIINQAYKGMRPTYHIERLDGTELNIEYDYSAVAPEPKESNVLVQRFYKFLKFSVVKNKQSGLYVSKVKYQISGAKNYLRDNNFGRFEYVQESGEDFLHIENNIIDEVTKSTMKLAIEKEMKAINANKILGYNTLQLDEIFHKTLANNLNSIFDYLLPYNNRISKTRLDTKTTAAIPFKNGLLYVTKDSRKLVPYINITGLVWRKNIIPYNYSEVNFDGSEIQKFLTLVTDDLEQLESICTMIGYLLHKYKDPTSPFIPILTDKDMEDFDKGGAGKSLIFKFIGILRNVAFENGKATEATFKFNNVGKETDVLLIDDLNRFHDLEQLNTMATGDTDINLKYGKILHLGFAYSPKVAATTNYFPDTMHPGVKRRVKIFEINNYFNEHCTPLQVFGHQLIDGWDNEQMNIEIHFLITCLELYLDLGLKVPTIDDADIRLLKVKIGADNISSFDLMEINEGMFIKKWHVYKAVGIDTSKKAKNKNRKEKIQATKNFESYLKVKGVKFEVKAERNGEFTVHGYKINGVLANVS